MEQLFKAYEAVFKWVQHKQIRELLTFDYLQLEQIRQFLTKEMRDVARAMQWIDGAIRLKRILQEKGKQEGRGK